MSLLTICQSVLQEIGNFEVPSSFVGNNNDTAAQMLAVANAAGDGIGEARTEGWQVQQIEHPFNTVADQENYAFPGQFNYPIQATWWDRGNQWYMYGPVTPQEWQRLKAFVSSASVRRAWRIRGDEILIFPTPLTTGDPILFEYVTTAWCSTADGLTLQTQWLADTDIPLMSERLFKRSIKWRFLKEKGLPYTEDFNEFQIDKERAIARDGGVARLRMSGAGSAYRYPIANTPEGSWPG